TLEQVRNSEVRPPRFYRSDTPVDLDTIVVKCLQKDPRHRYGAAAELADDLRRFLAGEPVRARRVNTAERLVKWCKRKPVVAGLVALLALVVISGTATSLL